MRMCVSLVCLCFVLSGLLLSCAPYPRAPEKEVRILKNSEVKKVPVSRVALKDEEVDRRVLVPPPDCALARRNLLRDRLEKELPLKEVVWETYLPGHTIRRITLLGDQLYVETNARSLYAVDIKYGKVLWVYSLGVLLDYPPGIVTGMPEAVNILLQQEKKDSEDLLDEQTKLDKREGRIEQLKSLVNEDKAKLRGLREYDHVYIVCNGWLHCIDRETGGFRWKKQLSFAPSTSPAARAGTVFIGSIEKNKVIGINSASQSEVGYYRAGKNTFVRPLVMDDLIHIPSDDGCVYTYNAAKGGLPEPLWVFQTGGAINCEVQPADQLLLIPSSDYCLYAVSRFSGTLRWKCETGSPITDSPIVCDQLAYLHSDNVGLMAVDVATGKSIWKVPCGEKFLLKGKHHLYVEGPRGVISVISADKGSIIGQFPVGDFPFLVSNPTGDSLFMATSDGYIFAVKESKQKF